MVFYVKELQQIKKWSLLMKFVIALAQNVYRVSPIFARN